MTKAVGKFGKKETRQMLYTILAVVFCFIGPTYFVAVMSRIIPQIYAVTIGFVCFLIGVVFVLRLIKEF